MRGTGLWHGPVCVQPGLDVLAARADPSVLRPGTTEAASGRGVTKPVEEGDLVERNTRGKVPNPNPEPGPEPIPPQPMPPQPGPAPTPLPGPGEHRRPPA
jgi:hypothetical protein